MENFEKVHDDKLSKTFEKINDNVNINDLNSNSVLYKNLKTVCTKNQEFKPSEFKTCISMKDKFVANKPFLDMTIKPELHNADKQNKNFIETSISSNPTQLSIKSKNLMPISPFSAKQKLPKTKIHRLNLQSSNLKKDLTDSAIDSIDEFCKDQYKTSSSSSSMSTLNVKKTVDLNNNNNNCSNFKLLKNSTNLFSKTPKSTCSNINRLCLINAKNNENLRKMSYPNQVVSIQTHDFCSYSAPTRSPNINNENNLFFIWNNVDKNIMNDNNNINNSIKHDVNYIDCLNSKIINLDNHDNSNFKIGTNRLDQSFIQLHNEYEHIYKNLNMISKNKFDDNELNKCNISIIKNTNELYNNDDNNDNNNHNHLSNSHMFNERTFKSSSLASVMSSSISSSSCGQLHVLTNSDLHQLLNLPNIRVIFVFKILF